MQTKTETHFSVIYELVIAGQITWDLQDSSLHYKMEVTIAIL